MTRCPRPALPHPAPRLADRAASALRRLAGALAMTLAPVLAIAQAAGAIADEAAPGPSPTVDTAALQAQMQDLAARTPESQGLRVEVEVGRLDPRLKLAPCAKVAMHLPVGFRPWGKTRVGLRCEQGPTRWNVYLPLTVKVFGTVLVTATALPAGHVLGEADLRLAEIDLTEASSPPVPNAASALGRALVRALPVGEGLRQAHLRPRQWFAAGDVVRVTAMGEGFAVQGEGLALSAGIDGSTVRVRTESGRIVSGLAVAERSVEMPL